MSGPADRRIAASGAWGTVEYARRSDGTWPAQDFVDNLEDKVKAALAVLFKRMADQGRITDDRKFKHEEGEIYAFKRFQIRLPCFRIGSSWFITHGFMKKKDRWPSTEITRARDIMREHKARLGGR